MSEMVLSPFGRKICQEFARAYEDSAMRRGGRKLRKASWEKLFEGITSNVDEKEAFLLAVEDLTKRGVLSVKWQRFYEGDRVQALYLEDPRLLFTLLGQESPEERETQAWELLASFSPVSRRSRGLLRHIQERKNAGVPGSFDSPELLGALLLFCRHMEESFLAEWEEGIPPGLPVRALSVRIYNDSKRLEACMKDFDSLFIEVYGERLSELYGLERAFPKTAFRGNISFEFEIDSDAFDRIWRVQDETVFLPLDTLMHIQRVVPVNPEKKILIIENLETFRYFNYSAHGFCGCVYGGGQANRADKALLKLLVSAGFSLFYFGDLDPEGLQIYHHFSTFCNGLVKPWGMEKAIYKQYSMYGYILDSAKMKKLLRLNIPELGGLIQCMRETGTGVEQEIISF